MTPVNTFPPMQPVLVDLPNSNPHLYPTLIEINRYFLLPGRSVTYLQFSTYAPILRSSTYATIVYKYFHLWSQYKLAYLLGTAILRFT